MDSLSNAASSASQEVESLQASASANIPASESERTPSLSLEGGDSGSSRTVEENRSMDWVEPGVLEISSHLSASQVARLSVGEKRGFDVLPAREGEPVCSQRHGDELPFFFFYQAFIVRLGMRFPLTEFQMSVLAHLSVAPSQLHPNAWGFLIAFESLCALLGLSCTLASFFHFFIVVHTGRAGRWGWTTLRGVHQRRLFEPYTDSFKRFKSGFFRVVAKSKEQPFFLSSPADPTADSLFPLYWSAKHHDRQPADYRPKCLGRRDKDVVEGLTEFIDQHGPVNAAKLIDGSFDMSALSSPNMNRPDFLSKLPKSALGTGLSKKRKVPPSGAPDPAGKKKSGPRGPTGPSAQRPSMPSGRGVRPDHSLSNLIENQPSLPDVATMASPLTVVRPATHSGTQVVSPTSASPASLRPTTRASATAGSSASRALVHVRSPPSASSDPTQGPSRLHRNPHFGMLWKDGITTAMAQAFSPPRHFCSPLPMSSDEMKEMDELQLQGMKAVALSKCLPVLRLKYAAADKARQRAEDDKKKSLQELEMAMSLLDEARAERDRAQKMRDEAVVGREAAEAGMAAADSLKEAAEEKAAGLMKELEGARQEAEQLRESKAQTVADMKDFRERAEKTEADLKAALTDLQETLGRTAQQSFLNAVEQIRVAHPGVNLDEKKIFWSAYVDDGRIVWPTADGNPPPDDGDSSDEEGVPETGAADKEGGGPS